MGSFFLPSLSKIGEIYLGFSSSSCHRTVGGGDYFRLLKPISDHFAAVFFLLSFLLWGVVQYR